jgi:hypothetical protein
MIEKLTAEDVFAKIEEDPSGQDGSVLAEVRDLRRYLTLVEAEMISRGCVEDPIQPPTERPVGTIEVNLFDALAKILGCTRDEARKKFSDVMLNEKPSSSERMVPRFEVHEPLLPLSTLSSPFERTSPGTPEDGGHHAGRMPESLQFGTLVEMPQSRSRYYMVTLDPRARGCRHALLDRRAVGEDYVKRFMLRDAVELNDKEHSEMDAAKRGLYHWDERQEKWLMADMYRELWGHD